MTPAEEALRDAWIAEMWKPVPEVPRHIRNEKRKGDRIEQRRLEEMALEAVHSPSPDAPHLPTRLSTGCAETGPGKVPQCATEWLRSVAESPCRPNESAPERGAENTDAPRGLAS